MEKKILEIKDYINIEDNALPYEALSSFLQWLNTLDTFHEATVWNEGEIKLKKHIRDVKSFSLPTQHQSKTLVHWHRVLISLFRKALKSYEQKYCLGTFNVNNFRNVDILKYHEGNHFSVHSDSASNEPRTISIIYLLNNDYEGGELVFTTPDTKEDYLTIENKPNRLVVFPSNFLYPHKVKPVTKGVRYSVVSWVI